MKKTCFSKNKIKLAAARLSLLSLLIPLSASAAVAEKLRTVKIGWPAGIATTVAHVSFGEELGFFKKDGFVTEIIPMQGSYNVLMQILSGGFDTGYVGVETIVTGRQEGAPNMPVVFAYNYIRQGIMEIVVPKDSPVKTLADLKGKTIGVAGPGFGNVPVTKAMIVASGLKVSDVDLLGVGVGGPAFQALTSGAIDALNLWETMHLSLEQRGFPLRKLAEPDGFEGNSTYGLPMTEAMIAKEPEFIGKFGRAWAKSTIACHVNVKGCLQAFWRAYPAQRPDLPEEEALAREIPILTARLNKIVHFGPGEAQRFGSFKNEHWDGILRAMSVGGAIKNPNISYNKLYTNQFVDAFNDFDREEVERIALKK